MSFAYLDAGSGNLIVQAAMGGPAGLAPSFKASRARHPGRDNAWPGAKDQADVRDG